MRLAFCYGLVLLLSLGALSCGSDTTYKEPAPDCSVKLVDSQADSATCRLYRFLMNVGDDHILFGQQDALIRGYGWMLEDRCELREVCGSYPAVTGWDFAWLNRKRRLRRLIRESNARGGIQTFSYHMDNPLTGRGTKDTTRTVEHILPSGKAHEDYLGILDDIADFAKSLTDEKGYHIPIIFRPFHEHTGHWFWWGTPHCTKDEFVSLWRFTVHYLRDSCQVHNFLYAYSPDTVSGPEHYLERYPGDDYVDIMGIDIYRDVENRDTANFLRRLRTVVQLANQHNKVAALTETGYSNHDERDWWTGFLLNPIKNDSLARQIAYMVLWANYRHDNFFSIYPGHFNQDDFLKLHADSFMVFEERLPGLFREYAP